MNFGPLLGHWWIPLLGYLLGSIPFGFVIARLRGTGDIRATGSGNIGAANVSRVVGPAAGLATLLLDAGKGYLAVWMAARVTGENATAMVAAALAAMIGHLFPLWLGFRGGRGVATGLGAFLPVCWMAVLAALLIWLVVVLFWRYISLGSVVAAASLPMLIYLLYAPGHAPPLAVSLGATLAAVLIVVRHRPNLERLIAGTEPRFMFRR